MAYLHFKGIVHRDINLQNILMTDQGIQIAQFGTAIFKSKIETSEMCGSPGFIAPEMYTGVYDELIDEYAAGVVLYRILCGHSPFYGSN